MLDERLLRYLAIAPIADSGQASWTRITSGLGTGSDGKISCMAFIGHMTTSCSEFANDSSYEGDWMSVARLRLPCVALCNNFVWGTYPSRGMRKPIETMVSQFLSVICCAAVQLAMITTHMLLSVAVSGRPTVVCTRMSRLG